MFKNISDKYGDYVTVTLADYQELNPEGEFVEHSDGIYEGTEKVAEIADLVAEIETYTSAHPEWTGVSEDALTRDVAVFEKELNSFNNPNSLGNKYLSAEGQAKRKQQTALRLELYKAGLTVAQKLGKAIWSDALARSMGIELD